MLPQPSDVLDFWFSEINRAFWFEQNEQFDRTMKNRFVPLLEQAASGELSQWADTADGALALVILFDQIPRNAFRGTSRAFAYDGEARRIAQIAIDAGFDQRLSVDEKLFLYLPFEHSEDADDQERCVRLVKGLRNNNYLDYALRHQQIIQRFGRFPHRNRILNRESTEEETQFLKSPDSSF